MAAMAAEQSVPQAVPPPLPRMVPVTASVVCMCGLPGSGKSTLARSLLDSSVVLDKEGEGGDVRGRSVLIDYDVLARDLAAATNEGDVAARAGGATTAGPLLVRSIRPGLLETEPKARPLFFGDGAQITLQQCWRWRCGSGGRRIVAQPFTRRPRRQLPPPLHEKRSSQGVPAGSILLGRVGR